MYRLLKRRNEVCIKHAKEIITSYISEKYLDLSDDKYAHISYNILIRMSWMLLCLRDLDVKSDDIIPGYYNFLNEFNFTLN